MRQYKREKVELNLAKATSLAWGLNGATHLALGLDGKPLSFTADICSMGFAAITHRAVKGYQNAIKNIENSFQYNEIVKRAKQIYGKK